MISPNFKMLLLLLTAFSIVCIASLVYILNRAPGARFALVVLPRLVFTGLSLAPRFSSDVSSSDKQSPRVSPIPVRCPRRATVEDGTGHALAHGLRPADQEPSRATHAQDGKIPAKFQFGPF